MISPTRFALIVATSFLLCACDTTPPVVVKPLDDPSPTPPPPTVDAPAFTHDLIYTLVMQVKLDPGISPNGATSKFFDMTRNGSSAWGNDYTETVYVVKSAVRRDIDNLDKIYVNLYRPDVHLFWTWKTGSVLHSVLGSVEQRPYDGNDPLDDELHLGFSGKWTQLADNQKIFGKVCAILRLTQDDGGVMEVMIDKATGFPVHIQSDDASIICSVKEFRVGMPDPTLFKPPAGAFIDKIDPTPTP